MFENTIISMHILLNLRMNLVNPATDLINLVKNLVNSIFNLINSVSNLIILQRNFYLFDPNLQPKDNGILISKDAMPSQNTLISIHMVVLFNHEPKFLSKVLQHFL